MRSLSPKSEIESSPLPIRNIHKTQLRFIGAGVWGVIEIGISHYTRLKDVRKLDSNNHGQGGDFYHTELSPHPVLISDSHYHTS